MDYRTLGAHGPTISTIGFGCWAMGDAAASIAGGSRMITP